jgi:hypothetical protein
MPSFAAFDRTPQLGGFPSDYGGLGGLLPQPEDEDAFGDAADGAADQAAHGVTRGSRLT